MVEKLFHMTPDGASRPCNAVKGNCPYGNYPHGPQQFLEQFQTLIMKNADAYNDRNTMTRSQKKNARKNARKKATGGQNNGTIGEAYSNVDVLVGSPDLAGNVLGPNEEITFIEITNTDEELGRYSKRIYMDGTMISTFLEDPNKGLTRTETYDRTELEAARHEIHRLMRIRREADSDVERLKNKVNNATKRSRHMKVKKGKDELYSLVSMTDDEIKAFEKTDQYSKCSSSYDKNSVALDLNSLNAHARDVDLIKDRYDEVARRVSEALHEPTMLKSDEKADVRYGILNTETGEERIEGVTTKTWNGSRPSVNGASKASAFGIVVKPPEGMTNDELDAIIARGNKLSGVKERRKFFEDAGFEFTGQAYPMNDNYRNGIEGMEERYGPGMGQALAGMAVKLTMNDQQSWCRQASFDKDDHEMWSHCMNHVAVLGTEDYNPSYAEYDREGVPIELHSSVVLTGTDKELITYNHIERKTRDEYWKYLDRTAVMSATINVGKSKDSSDGSRKGETKRLECANVGGMMVFPVCLTTTLRTENAVTKAEKAAHKALIDRVGTCDECPHEDCHEECVSVNYQGKCASCWGEIPDELIHWGKMPKIVIDY